MKLSMRLKMDQMVVQARLSKNVKKTQLWLDNEVAKDTEPYVPYRKGVTTKSVYPSKNAGKGQLEYNTPYARYLYRGLKMVFNKGTHPKASAQWFEKSKAANKKKWVDGAQKIMKGGS